MLGNRVVMAMRMLRKFIQNYAECERFTILTTWGCQICLGVQLSLKHTLETVSR